MTDCECCGYPIDVSMGICVNCDNDDEGWDVNDKPNWFEPEIYADVARDPNAFIYSSWDKEADYGMTGFPPEDPADPNSNAKQFRDPMYTTQLTQGRPSLHEMLRHLSPRKRKILKKRYKKALFPEENGKRTEYYLDGNVHAIAKAKDEHRDEKHEMYDVDPGPIPFSQIEQNDDEIVLDDLEDYQIDPETSQWRICAVPMWMLPDLRFEDYDDETGTRDREYVEDLAEAIERGEVKTPILCFLDKEGGVILIDGYHRTCAANELGFTHLYAYMPYEEKAFKEIESKKKLNPVNIKGIDSDAKKILHKFWHDNPDLRKGCLDKYGYDPIDEELDYWRYGMAEPEHKMILEDIMNNDGIINVEQAKRWTKSELAAEKKEAKIKISEMNQSDEIPPAPGTTPIPSNYARIYHYTGADPDVIRQEGLRIQNAKGDTYGEPNVVWGSAQPNFANEQLNKGWNVVEFAVAHDDPRWDIGKYTPGVKYEENDGSPEAWAKSLTDHGSHVTFWEDITPQDIIAVHEPWHQAYRYIMENYDPNSNEFDWVLQDNTPEIAPYRKALELLKQKKRANIKISVTEDPYTPRIIEQSKLPSGYAVSTVELPEALIKFDNLFGDIQNALGFDPVEENTPNFKAPGVYETMVFAIDENGKMDTRNSLEFLRYNNEEDARKGHAEVVERWKDGPPFEIQNIPDTLPEDWHLSHIKISAVDPTLFNVCWQALDYIGLDDPLEVDLDELWHTVVFFVKGYPFEEMPTKEEIEGALYFTIQVWDEAHKRKTDEDIQPDITEMEPSNIPKELWDKIPKPDPLKHNYSLSSVAKKKCKKCGSEKYVLIEKDKVCKYCLSPWRYAEKEPGWGGSEMQRQQYIINTIGNSENPASKAYNAWAKMRINKAISNGLCPNCNGYIDKPTNNSIFLFTRDNQHWECPNCPFIYPQDINERNANNVADNDSPSRYIHIDREDLKERTDTDIPYRKLKEKCKKCKDKKAGLSGYCPKCNEQRKLISISAIELWEKDSNIQDVMYHVAPVAAREDIFENGLRGEGFIHLWSNFDQALKWAKQQQDIGNSQQEIYHVDVTGLQINPDAPFEATGANVLKGDITPDRLIDVEDYDPRKLMYSDIFKEADITQNDISDANTYTTDLHQFTDDNLAELRSRDKQNIKDIVSYADRKGNVHFVYAEGEIHWGKNTDDIITQHLNHQMDTYTTPVLVGKFNLKTRKVTFDKHTELNQTPSLRDSFIKALKRELNTYKPDKYYPNDDIDHSHEEIYDVKMGKKKEEGTMTYYDIDKEKNSESFKSWLEYFKSDDKDQFEWKLDRWVKKKKK